MISQGPSMLRFVIAAFVIGAVLTDSLPSINNREEVIVATEVVKEEIPIVHVNRRRLTRVIRELKDESESSQNGEKSSSHNDITVSRRRLQEQLQVPCQAKRLEGDESSEDSSEEKVQVPAQARRLEGDESSENSSEEKVQVPAQARRLEGDESSENSSEEKVQVPAQARRLEGDESSETSSEEKVQVPAQARRLEGDEETSESSSHAPKETKNTSRRLQEPTQNIERVEALLKELEEVLKTENTQEVPKSRRLQVSNEAPLTRSEISDEDKSDSVSKSK
jgi:hypothetical protein